MMGTGRKVLRILSVAAVVALVAAGCGSAPQPQAERGLPRALAQEWATRASAVAHAAAAGDDCQALQLASSLRDEIIAREDKVPARLQKPLVQGANALADRFTCTLPAQTVTVPPPVTKPTKPPDHKPPHRDHKHGGGGGDHQ
jgi:hypothetical protein